MNARMKLYPDSIESTVETLNRLRGAGVSHVALDEDGAIREVSFFDGALGATQHEASDQQKSDVKERRFSAGRLVPRVDSPR